MLFISLRTEINVFYTKIIVALAKNSSFCLILHSVYFKSFIEIFLMCYIIITMIYLLAKLEKNDLVAAKLNLFCKLLCEE